MIDYDPHNWWGHFFDIRGSMVREIMGRVLLFTVWATVVVAADKTFGGDWSISLPLLGLVGAALGFLLVFRTNSSYDKFWEGRKLWGGIVNETRNLGRQAVVHLGPEPSLQDQLLRWTAVWPYAVMQRLRGHALHGLSAPAQGLPPAEVAEVMRAANPPLAIAVRMSALLLEARRRGLYGEVMLAAIDQNVQLLVDYFGACERIKRTPLPFAYMVHVRRALILYCTALPFALVQEAGWGTILDTLAVSYIFFGIEEIGVIIEDPFGVDDNDLPLERITAGIQADLAALGQAVPGTA